MVVESTQSDADMRALFREEVKPRLARHPSLAAATREEMTETMEKGSKEWTEALTIISRSDVPDELYQRVREYLQEVAPDLLGAVLRHETDAGTVAVRITERTPRECSAHATSLPSLATYMGSMPSSSADRKSVV